MTGKSSYLRHLPPVLWEDEPGSSELSLGALLRIFEKVLTGIPDGVDLRHGEHVHGSLREQIDALEKVFDPWLTRADFLPWLASWVALEFPTLQGEAVWDEYQQRTVIAEISQIYGRRGQRSALRDYLDLYTLGRARPRITVDDGNRVLLVEPGPPARVTGLVTQGPVTGAAGVVTEGVVRPSSVTASPDGSLFLGDLGVESTSAVQPRVWKLGPAGQYPVAGAPPQPQPLAVGTLPTTAAVGLAVRPARGTAPETLYVLDRSGGLHAIPSPFDGVPATRIATLAINATLLRHVPMGVDVNGDLLILDRGTGPGTAKPPALVTVTVTADPAAVTRTPLTQVIEPLSLLVEVDGTLLVGDGRQQQPASAGQRAGNLVRVRRGAVVQEELVLPTANPLVAPTGLARGVDGALYVLDGGLKPWEPSSATPFLMDVAEPAAVHRIADGGAGPVVTRLTAAGEFVNPTGMAAVGDRLVVCDPGHRLQPPTSRTRPFELDIVVHFAKDKVPSDATERRRVLRQAVASIRDVVEQEKPAHTVANVVTRT